jgi:hypothetical protein
MKHCLLPGHCLLSAPCPTAAPYCPIAAAAAAAAAAAPNEDPVKQHQHAKEMLQLTVWMAAVGQGDKEMLVRGGGGGGKLHSHPTLTVVANT